MSAKSLSREEKSPIEKLRELMDLEVITEEEIEEKKKHAFMRRLLIIQLRGESRFSN